MNSKDLAYQEFDADLHQIVYKVFSGPVQPPHTYQIIFDPNEIDPRTNYTQYVFEQLMLMFTEGLKIFYGQVSIDISLISPPDFYKIQQHFHSMGFIINCQIEKILDEEKLKLYLESGELPSFNNDDSSIIDNSIDDDSSIIDNSIDDDSSNDYQGVHKSSSGQSKIETTGENLSDYRFTLIKGNDRYIISFDYLS